LHHVRLSVPLSICAFDLLKIGDPLETSKFGTVQRWILVTEEANLRSKGH